MIPVSILSVLLLFLEGIQLCFSTNSSLACLAVERQALLQLKQSFEDPSNRLVSWTGEDCCHWRGVSCSQSTGHVVKLDLGVPNCWVVDFLSYGAFVDCSFFEQLTAVEVHSSLAELKHLEYLDLSGNDFNQTRIPEFLGSLDHLGYLNLSYAGFGGEIPHQLGNLTRLQVLDLSYGYTNFYSYFSEPLYAGNLRWASSLSSLQQLKMSGVNLSNAIDLMPVISKLPSLLHLSLGACGIQNIHFPYGFVNSTFLSSIQHLDLHSNRFVGPIPNALKNMTSLNYLDISRNDFSSTFPLWLVKSKSISHLNVKDNKFDNIENGLFSMLNNACSLKSLDLSFNRFGNAVLKSGTNSSRCTTYDAEFLTLEGNQIDGNIPDWLGKLEGLKYLSLGNNSLSGPIPQSLGSLSALKNLDFSQNELSGSIPQSLKNLSALESLDFSQNQLSGSIPQSLGNLSTLKYLDFSQNHLNGTIPQSFGSFPFLWHFDLSHNRLTGTIPQSLGRLSSLFFLRLSHNQLSGIPESLGQLLALFILDISSNPFEGVVMTEHHFANLSRLHALVMSSINLSWKVESNWIPPFSLSYLNISSTRLGPQVSQWLQTQTEVSKLDLSNSNISADFPPLPRSPGLTYLDLSANQITGSLPANIADTMPHLGILILENNLINGSFSNALCDLKGLQILDISQNMLSGEIPDCQIQSKEVSVINLSYNKFSGSIPQSFGRLLFLRWLHLSGNNLSGELPSSMKSCTSLELLDIGENDISGAIPTWVGESLLSLKVLRLRNNMFNGNIPLELCQLSKVQILDLAVNNLTGGIPHCLGKLKGMTENSTASEEPALEGHVFRTRGGPPVGKEQWHKEKVSVYTKGAPLEYTTTLLLLDGLDLSSNMLNGSIPDELCGLTGLRTLNLSHNHLTGKIPEHIGNFKSLESFDLSDNRLFGPIPQAISMLSSLNHLNLSYNYLSGKIPTGNQLQTLDDPSIYTGNLQLCGAPLTKKCVDELPKPPTSSGRGDKDHGDDIKEKILFWFVVTTGYTTGFWAVIVVLVLKKNWRIACFRFVENTKERTLAMIEVKVARLKQRIQRT